MSTDFGPKLQRLFHSEIVPRLIKGLDDAQNPKVVAHACAATINFCEKVERVTLEAYLPTTLPALFKTLQSTNKVVQEQAITAVAAIAGAAGMVPLLTKIHSHFPSFPNFHHSSPLPYPLSFLSLSLFHSGLAFTPFYDNFMPILKEVMVKVTNKDLRMLRCKAIECISLIGVAVGKDRFSAGTPLFPIFACLAFVPFVHVSSSSFAYYDYYFTSWYLLDAAQVMEVLAKIQTSNMDADDPQREFILQAWTRIASTLGKDFIPYLQYVMPPVFAAAQTDAGVKILDVRIETNISEKIVWTDLR